MSRAAPATPVSWRVPALVMAATVLVFGVVAFGLTRLLREDLRAQILRREAEALRSMIELQQERANEEFASSGLGADLADWFPLLLETSALRGVVALRLFDAQGALRDALPLVAEAKIGRGDWGQLQRGENVVRLHPRAALAALRVGGDVTAKSGAATAPLLEVLVPLREPVASKFGGVAQYWIDGEPMQGEFAALDRNLWLRSGGAVLVGALVVVLALAWAFRRLQATNRELKARTEDLARANQEFSVAAKTSALGAITAHLMHGLKNPLAGLEGFVSGQGNGGETNGEEWQTAMETTRRLRGLVNEVVNILREEQQGGAEYAVTTGELLGRAEVSAQGVAGARGVTLVCRSDVQAELPSRRANLVLLVLDNLLRNACEATPPGHRVTLLVAPGEERIIFFVEDEGPGLPDAVSARLFQPVSSTKPGGGGIGLVISRHLAQHAGGQLELVKSGVNGCCFRLSVPTA